MAPHRRDDAELGKMSTDRIDDGSLLANEEVPGAMERQAALLLRRLGGNEPHRRPPNGLADRLRVRSIVLLSLDVGLHVGCRHQAHRVAEELQFRATKNAMIRKPRYRQRMGDSFWKNART